MAEANTKEGESAQALFCAIIDNQGKKLEILPDYKTFKEKYQDDINAVKGKVDIDIPITSLERFLLNDKNIDWYKSSINTANKLFEDIEKLSASTANKIKPKGIQLFYVRGDNDVFSSLAKIFKHTKETMQKTAKDPDSSPSFIFENINKWNPADIYFATDKAKIMLRNISNGQNVKYAIGTVKMINLAYFKNFQLLNEFIRLIIKDGDLLPLSLKKAPNQVKIKKINFLESDYAKAMENVSYESINLTSPGSKSIFSSIDFRIFFQGKYNLQFRDKVGPNHFNFNFTCTIAGGSQAFDGSISGGTIGDVISELDPQLGKQFSVSNLQKLGKSLITVVKSLIENKPVSLTDKKILVTIFKYCKSNVSSLMMNYNNDPKSINQFYLDFGNYLNNLTNKIDGEKIPYSIAQKTKAGANVLLAKYFGGLLIAKLANHKFKNEIIVALVATAASRSKNSGPHLKASDPSAF